MRHTLAAFALLAFASAAGANTYTAASSSLSDVQKAVRRAADGDTVQIPCRPATSTWSGELSISKSITLTAEGATPNTGAATHGAGTLCLTILATQKTTGDSIPTSLRDNSGLAVSFALKTTESSVAALGDAIREYPGYSPTLLRETPNGIGTAIATLTTGTDPFTRLRVPEIAELWAFDHATATACHRRDLDLVVLAEPILIPGPVPDLSAKE